MGTDRTSEFDGVGEDSRCVSWSAYVSTGLDGQFPELVFAFLPFTASRPQHSPAFKIEIDNYDLLSFVHIFQKLSMCGSYLKTTS